MNMLVFESLRVGVVTIFYNFIQGITKFYDQVIQAILRHVNFDSEWNVLIAKMDLKQWFLK